MCSWYWVFIVEHESASVPVSSNNICHTDEPNAGRSISVGGCAITNLAIDVVSPTSQTGIPQQRTRVPSPCCKLSHVDEANAGWSPARDRRAISNLPKVVVTPALDAGILH